MDKPTDRSIDNLRLLNINPREYHNDLHDCIICIKYLKEFNIYEDQRIGILRFSLPGFNYFPKGSYVLFKENYLSEGKCIIEKPHREDDILESIVSNACDGTLLGFINYKALNIPKDMIDEAVLNYKSNVENSEIEKKL